MYSTLLKENPKFVYRRLLWVKLSAKTKSLYKDCLKQSFEIICLTFTTRFKFDNYFSIFLYPPLPEGGVYTVLPLSFRPSVQDIFRRFYLSNCWWQKSDIWSRASYRYTILWVAFLDPSDSYFLFADLVGFYTQCTFFVTFLSATIDGRNLIFGHKLHKGTPYRGKRFWSHQIPTSCLPILLIFIHI